MEALQVWQVLFAWQSHQIYLSLSCMQAAIPKALLLGVFA